MGLGLVLGGAADGFAKGMKLSKDYEEEKRNREKRTQDRESDAILGQIKAPGELVDGRFTTERAVNDALKTAKPKPDIIERMIQGISHKLDPQGAATAAGLPTPANNAAAAQAQADAGGLPATPASTDGAAFGPQGAPVDEIAVTAPEQREMSEVERAQLMYAAATHRRDPTAIAAAQDGLIKAEASEGGKNMMVAAANGPHALVNFAHRMGIDGDFETTASGGVRFKSDTGDYVGGEYKDATEFANANLLPILQRSPQLGMEIASKFHAERNADKELDSNISYRKAMVEAARARTEIERQRATSQGAVETEDTRAKKGVNDIKDAWGKALSDPTRNSLVDDTLDKLAPQVAGLGDDAYKGDPILDEEGKVTGYQNKSHAADAMAARRMRDQQVFNNTPEVKAGHVGIAMVGGSKAFVVRSPKGGMLTDTQGTPLTFKSPDEAAFTARKIWQSQGKK